MTTQSPGLISLLNSIRSVPVEGFPPSYTLKLTEDLAEASGEPGWDQL